MKHSAISRQIRERRRESGLTQAALADRSGTGRVTLARLEAGTTRDCRVGTLSRLCEAVGLELAAVAPGSEQAHETQLVRAREQLRRIDARRRHAELATRLLASSPGAAAALVARARANVDRWEERRLCSRHYISRWRAILSGSPRRITQRLVSYDAWTDALFQNTPWSFALPPAAV
jgi:transcriptional regulator with XRE-family HTH domain